MTTIADQIRARAAALHKEATELEAIASKLDGQSDAQRAFLGDPRASAIAIAVCTELGVPIEQVLSDDRHAHVVFARDCCAHAFRNLLGFALQRVANALGKLDHNTTAAALRRVADRRQVDKHYAAELSRAMKAAHAALAKLEGIENDSEATEPLLARVG